MDTRVSTAGNTSAILANLMAAQQRQVDAGNRVATQKNGDDLKAYANKAEQLTAMQTVSRRLTAYSAQNDIIAAKLTTQDQGLNQVADAATAARQAITDALASDSAASLMQNLQAQFSSAVDGMNSQYDGKYVFAGGQINTKPVTATAMTDLTSGPPIASFFKNDQFKTTAKLDDTSAVTTGVLASDLGTNMMTAFQSIQAFNDSAAGPLTGQLTAAQRTFLESQLGTWDGIRTTLTDTTAANGLMQSHVDQVKTNLTKQSDTLTGMMGDITDADMAKAATDLSSAGVAVQASAQVLLALQSSSLLNLLK